MAVSAGPPASWTRRARGEAGGGGHRCDLEDLGGVRFVAEDVSLAELRGVCCGDGAQRRHSGQSIKAVWQNI
ncbi:hypothetical protein M6B38_244515 [Iris pallida]|uniref:Uncharacterized protein n=1 Tax=Iris pallida TaxID=29817 RepID=A0AAX6DHZ9_IRIPA|nr:hypothetical protein M6B38_244515 [Iris pallida]